MEEKYQPMVQVEYCDVAQRRRRRRRRRTTTKKKGHRSYAPFWKRALI